MIARAACAIALIAIIGLPSTFATAGAQSASSPAPSSSGTPSSSPSGAGAGGSGLPIEATILAYQSLQSDADSIAAAVAKTLPAGSKIVVATPTDVAAILQLRIILYQIATLNERFDQLRTSLYSLPCSPPKPPPHARTNSSWITPFLGLFSTPSDIQTMVGIVAGLSSSTESLSAQSGSFTDATLTNLVANSLVRQKVTLVYVPGVVPPNIMTVPPAEGPPAYISDSDRTHSYLYRGLADLDQNRMVLQKELKSVFDGKCKKDLPDRIVLTKLVTVAATTADNFENAILGGPLVIPSTSLLTIPSPSPSPAKKSAGTKSISGTPAAISNTITVNAPPPSQPALASAPTPPSSPSPLQQLLYVDLLLRQLAYGKKSPVLTDVYILSVHALESGGNQLTKASMFLGTRVYYSGGSAATFTLIGSNGSMVCSGIAYGYRGFVKADDIALAVERKVGNNNPTLVPGTQNALPNGQRYTPTCGSR